MKKKDVTNTTADDLLIPDAVDWSVDPKSILFEIQFCQTNEKVAKSFLTKFNEFTNIRYKTNICGEKYVGETIRNVVTRWREREDVRKDSEPARHLKNNIDHVFNQRLFYMPINSIKNVKT